jgi:hypothetical protein
MLIMLRGYLKFLRCRVPVWRPIICEKTHRKGRSCDNPNALALQVGKQVDQGGVIDPVVAVGQDDIHRAWRHPVEHVRVDAEGQPGDPDEPRLPALLDLPERGNRLVHNLQYQ